MAVGAQRDIDAGRAQHAFDLAPDLLAVLQCAGRMIGDPFVDLALQLVRQGGFEIGQDFADVAGQC